MKRDNKWLSKYKKNVCSQRGEDGVLEKVFEVIGIKSGFCVDVGAYGKSLSNTYALIANGWSGVLIEGNTERLAKLEKYHRRGNRTVYCINKYVQPNGDQSLDSLLKETPLPHDFEFLSIDIDGNDYYIWESLKDYSPSVVIIEFNSFVKFDDYLQPFDGVGGASLTKVIELGKNKGYELVATTAFNAIFVKKDLFPKFEITNNSLIELWEPDSRDFSNPSMPIYKDDKSFEISTIIFSKNRACQLELLLRSLNIPSTVLYTFDPEFKAGYDKVMNMYPSVEFVRENGFRESLMEIINKGKKYVMFLVDDDVMVKPFFVGCEELTEFANNPDIIALSMRMSPDYRYRGLPNLKNNTWEWRRYARGSAEYHEYLRIWGYPMCVGANMFRREDVLETLNLAPDIKTPSYLEGSLNLKVPNRNLVKCFDKAKFINNEANQVQSDFRSSTMGVSLSELEDRFLKGEKLSLSDIINKAQNVRDYFIKTEYKWENEIN